MQYTKFPNQPDQDRHRQKGDGEKSLHKEHGGEHHQMVPVKNTAGGAALVFHDQPERTPNQHTDQIAHIKKHADEEQMGIGKDAAVFQKAQGGDQRCPQEHNFIS